MISRAAQTSVSIPHDDILSSVDEVAIVAGASIAKHLRQPRGRDFVPYLADMHVNGYFVDYLGTTRESVTSLMFPTNQRPSQIGQAETVKEQSPFRVLNDSRDIMSSNTPLRDGPGPLHLHSPGLSPIVRKNLDKENVEEDGRRPNDMQTTQGIAYRPALKEINQAMKAEVNRDGVPKDIEQSMKINVSCSGTEEESKLLSMEMLHDTTLSAATEPRPLNLPTHHQLHNDSKENQRESSLELISLLAEQSSVQTPQRSQGKTAKPPDESLVFISPLKASCANTPAHHNENKKVSTAHNYPHSLALGIVDGAGSPVAIPMRVPASKYGQGDTGRKSVFTNATGPSVAIVSSSWSKPTMMSSNFWKERMSRRSMSSVLSSPSIALL